MKDSDGKFRLVRKETTYEHLFKEEGGNLA
jgi:hypothetical protein